MSWNSVCTPGWPQTQRSPCLCLPSAVVKGVWYLPLPCFVCVQYIYIYIYSPQLCHFWMWTLYMTVLYNNVNRLDTHRFGRVTPKCSSSYWGGWEPQSMRLNALEASIWHLRDSVWKPERFLKNHPEGWQGWVLMSVMTTNVFLRGQQSQAALPLPWAFLYLRC
jgi:hypothetical protein